MSNRTATPAAIQPVGFHISVSPDWIVSAVSANLADFLPGSKPRLRETPLTALFDETAIHDLRNRMALLRGEDSIEHLLHCQLIASGDPFDISIYRNGDGFGIDAETCAGTGLGDAVGVIEGMLARTESGGDIDALCEAAARQIRSLTGYDGVSVDVAGAVRGRSARTGSPVMESPPPTPHFMACDTGTKAALVMTSGSRAAACVRSDLRALAPAELEWLEACGVRGAMVLPLTIDGTVKGHVCCLHAAPRHVSLERRGIARLFSSIVAHRLEIAELRCGGDRGA